MQARKKLIREFKIKEMQEDGKFSGYGAVFGNVDSYGDIILPGAFKNHLATNAPEDTKLLWQHNTQKPLGTWEDIKEDDNGLLVKGQLCMEVQKAREAHALLKCGAISGLSIGYSINSGGSRFGADGFNYLTDLKLWEISIVTFPANPEANVNDVKNMTPKDFENFLRDAGGFTKSQAKRIIARGFKPDILRDAESDDETDADHELLSKLNLLSQTVKGVLK